jgi:hypothetical protein
VPKYPNDALGFEHSCPIPALIEQHYRYMAAQYVSSAAFGGVNETS